MKASHLFLSLFLIANVGFAADKEVRVSLPCKMDKQDIPKGIKSYTVIKVAKPKESPKTGDTKWTERFLLKVEFTKRGSQPKEYYFGKSVSGDEDYNEYPLVVPKEEADLIAVQAANIQNRFEWANLINNDGVGFAQCEKP